MLKRLFLGVVALILVALAIIIAAWLRFDIPREELQAKYGSEASIHPPLIGAALPAASCAS
ncbi:MAG: hypothetical protein AAFY01_00805, partial [Pseudomonadota bacterium]